MTRFFRYILVSDDGRAPCVDDGLITLATCKPQIRSSANVGDWVAGYMPKGLGEGLLCWIGRVGETMSPTDYERRFRGRKDAQYRLHRDGEVERVDLEYHPGANEQRKDCSAKVLIFDRQSAWYFGDRPIQPPMALERLKAVGQGHRVNFRLPDDLNQIQNWLSSIGEPGLYGQPRSGGEVGCGAQCAGPTRKVSKGC